MSPWRRSPRPFSLAIDAAADRLQPETLLAEVQRRWPEAVGAAINGEARPTSERGGVLTIACSSSVWAQELDLMAPGMIERLNQALGASRISRLRCVTLPIRNELP